MKKLVLFSVIITFLALETGNSRAKETNDSCLAIKNKELRLTCQTEVIDSPVETAITRCEPEENISDEEKIACDKLKKFIGLLLTIKLMERDQSRKDVTQPESENK